MCEHCGCRGIEPIAELMDEHFELLEMSGDIRRSLTRGDRAAALILIPRLSELLDSHVRAEERGIFAAMKSQGEFVEAVVELEGQHASFHGTLASLDEDAADFDECVYRLMDELSQHIDKENLGIFPVAVVTLGASGWETVSRARRGSSSNPTPEATHAS